MLGAYSDASVFYFLVTSLDFSLNLACTHYRFKYVAGRNNDENVRNIGFFLKNLKKV